MTAIIMSSITALISAGIGVAIWALQKKIDRMEKDADKRNAQQGQDQNNAEAKISALTARVARGEIVNGDLEQAEKDLAAKKETLSAVTNRIVAQYMEG